MSNICLNATFNDVNNADTDTVFNFSPVSYMNGDGTAHAVSHNHYRSPRWDALLDNLDNIF